jgi:hypothetical protein
MLEPSGELGLTEKPFRSDVRRQLQRHDFESHRAVVLEIAGKVDRGHAAWSQLMSGA